MRSPVFSYHCHGHHRAFCLGFLSHENSIGWLICSWLLYGGIVNITIITSILIIMITINI